MGLSMENDLQGTLFVPGLDDGQASYEWMFRTRELVLQQNTPVRISFLFCQKLSPGAVAFIGGLIRLAQSKQISVIVEWDTVIDETVLKFLRHNGFSEFFGGRSHGWDSHCIPYREDRFEDCNSVMDYLTDNWIGRGWLQVSERLKNAIAGKMWEIYTNSFEHGLSPVGVFSCGHHYSNKNELVLTVIDFGVGIATNVKDFLRSDPRSARLSSSACVEWALQRGNTTSNLNVARGLGLDFLRNFVILNEGSLEIYSNSAHALINKDGVTVKEIESNFSGTLVQIKLQCDERLYSFKNEVNS